MMRKVAAAVADLGSFVLEMKDFESHLSQTLALLNRMDSTVSAVAVAAES